MARNILADNIKSDTPWRAVLVWKMRDTGELVYEYQGVYPKKGTAKGQVTYNKNSGWKIFEVRNPDNYWSPIQRYADFYDGWVEQGVLSWILEKD